MGKSCVRIRTIDDVPLDVLARAIKRATLKKFIASYESARDATPSARRKAAKKTTKKKPQPERASSKKAAHEEGRLEEDRRPKSATKKGSKRSDPRSLIRARGCRSSS